MQKTPRGQIDEITDSLLAVAGSISDAGMKAEYDAVMGELVPLRGSDVDLSDSLRQRVCALVLTVTSPALEPEQNTVSLDPRRPLDIEELAALDAEFDLAASEYRFGSLPERRR